MSAPDTFSVFDGTANTRKTQRPIFERMGGPRGVYVMWNLCMLKGNCCGKWVYYEDMAVPGENWSELALLELIERIVIYEWGTLLIRDVGLNFIAHPSYITCTGNVSRNI